MRAIVILAVLLIAGLVAGIMIPRLLKAQPNSEVAKAVSDEDSVASVGEVIFDATAELQSLFLAMQSMIVPQSIELQAGSAQVVFDGPIAEVSVLLFTLLIGLVIIWKVRK